LGRFTRKCLAIRVARRINAIGVIMIKLSGVGLGHPKWTIGDTASLLRRAIDIFGVERAMFGTNLPVDRLFAEPGRIIACYANVLQGFDAAAKLALTRKNAERAYRI